MRKTLLRAAIVGSLLLISGFACYASGPGTTGANFLKIGVGSRATAMGGAFTAISDDATALYWNPSGLAQIEGVEISAMYNMHFQEIKQGYLSLTLPLLGGTLGLGVNYVDMGKIEGRDEHGYSTGDFGASDIQASLAYANKISSRLMFGVSAGMLQHVIANYKKTAYLGNVGLLIRPTESFSLGLTCQNIGPKLGEDPLPLTYRGGLALRLRSLNVEADAVKPIDDDIYYCAGLEWWIGNILALRCGYRTDQDIGSGISYGAGLRIKGLELNGSYADYGELGKVFRACLSIRFGVAPAPVRKPGVVAPAKPEIVAPPTVKPEVVMGRVAKITDHTLYINLGTVHGVKLADKFIIYRMETIIDPLTREVIGTIEKEVGVVEVIKVEKTMSLARILEGTEAIEVGDNVKRSE